MDARQGRGANGDVYSFPCYQCFDNPVGVVTRVRAVTETRDELERCAEAPYDMRGTAYLLMAVVTRGLMSTAPALPKFVTHLAEGGFGVTVAQLPTWFEKWYGKGFEDVA